MSKISIKLDLDSGNDKDFADFEVLGIPTLVAFVAALVMAAYVYHITPDPVRYTDVDPFLNALVVFFVGGFACYIISIFANFIFYWGLLKPFMKEKLPMSGLRLAGWIIGGAMSMMITYYFVSDLTFFNDKIDQKYMGPLLVIYLTIVAAPLFFWLETLIRVLANKISSAN